MLGESHAPALEKRLLQAPNKKQPPFFMTFPEHILQIMLDDDQFPKKLGSIIPYGDFPKIGVPQINGWFTSWEILLK